MFDLVFGTCDSGVLPSPDGQLSPFAAILVTDDRYTRGKSSFWLYDKCSNDV